MSEKPQIRRVVSRGDTQNRRTVQVVSGRIGAERKKRRSIRIVHGARSPGPGRLAYVRSGIPMKHDQAKLGTKRYRLRETIASGGFGRVYRADDSLVGMPVAIKILKPRLLKNPEAVKAFKREARVAMQLSHPHIVRLFNLVRPRDRYFLVMEYVEGCNFRDILDEHGRLALDSVMQIVRVCADALSYAHGRGILHNDLKPDNIMYDLEGMVRIIDFGTAGLKQVRAGCDFIEGTPAYMSPEQIRGEELDFRSDEFSLGVTAAELLSGVRPFKDDLSLAEHLEHRESPVLPDVPDSVRGVIARAIHPDREQRWPSLAEFANAFEDVARAVEQ